MLSLYSMICHAKTMQILHTYMIGLLPVLPYLNALLPSSSPNVKV